MDKQSKNEELLKEFVEYCGQRPDLRFWQALRNWSQYNFILGAETLQGNGDFEGIEDTFYREGK